MVSAIALWVPIASMVTRAPSSASRSSSSGMAAISFDLPATASCPSTRRWRLAQAETRCRGPRPLPRAWVRRGVLPSTATRSGSASRRPSTQRVKQPLNSSGSSAATTSPSVSWLGAPWREGKDAGPVGQEAAQEGQVLAAPERDLDEVVRAGQRPAEQEEDDPGQGVEHLGLLPRVLEGREVVEQRAAGGSVHGRLRSWGIQPAGTVPGRKLTAGSSDRPEPSTTGS